MSIFIFFYKMKTLYIIRWLLPRLIQNVIKYIYLKWKISWNIVKIIQLTYLKNWSIKIWKNVYIWTLNWCEIQGWFEIWDYSSLNDNIMIHCNKKHFVKIGKFCSIANWASFIATSHNYKNLTTHAWKIKPENYELLWAPIIIGNDVRIWKNAIIMKWITIWNWAVIWGWAVVTKNIPPYAIVWWNPAKIIKYRFNKKTIEKLLKSERRDWNEEEIKKNYYLEFLEKLQ